MEFVITDIIIDIPVCFEGSLQDLFQEVHSVVVVEGFVKLAPPVRFGSRPNVSEKARKVRFFFKAMKVRVKHD